MRSYSANLGFLWADLPLTEAIRAARRARFDALRPLIGHVQIAGVPDRGRPDRGTIDIASLVPSLGWDGHVGAEYRLDGAPEASLDWLPRAG